MICGSSSRGSASTAITPSAIDATMTSGVSFESMKAAARRPAGPRSVLIDRLQPPAPPAPDVRSVRPSLRLRLRRIDHAVTLGETRHDLDEVAAGHAELDQSQARLVTVDDEHDVTWPWRRTADAGITRAFRAPPGSRARPKVPDFAAGSASASLTSTARVSESTARAISCTVARTSVCPRPSSRSSSTGTLSPSFTNAIRDSSTRTSNRAPAGLLDSQQWRAGRHHVAWLDELLGDETVEGREDGGKPRREPRGFAGGAWRWRVQPSTGAGGPPPRRGETRRRAGTRSTRPFRGQWRSCARGGRTIRA